MNKITPITITFMDPVIDEKRIEIAFSRLFEKARRNILVKRQLTSIKTHKYTEVQHGRKLLNN